MDRASSSSGFDAARAALNEAVRRPVANEQEFRAGWVELDALLLRCANPFHGPSVSLPQPYRPVVPHSLVYPWETPEWSPIFGGPRFETGSIHFNVGPGWDERPTVTSINSLLANIVEEVKRDALRARDPKHFARRKG